MSQFLCERLPDIKIECAEERERESAEEIPAVTAGRRTNQYKLNESVTDNETAHRSYPSSIEPELCGTYLILSESQKEVNDTFNDVTPKKYFGCLFQKS